MAEKGQLADIISRYLELASVIAFNTKLDLKNATNLVDGSICKTLGFETYNDGKGNFYKIREITLSDVVDDVNIIAITNSEDLVAELIPNFYLENAVNELDNSINSKINELNDSIDNEKYGMWGISRSIRNNDHYLYFSDDGETFYKVGDILPNVGSDSSAVIEINDIFYYVGNNTYQYSEDLVNWSDAVVITESSRNVWGSMFHYDEATEKIYCYQSYQYNDNTITNVVGNTTYKFKVIVREGTINDDHTITFSNIQDVTSDTENFYDPYFIEDPVHGKLIAIVDTYQCKISVYKMSDFRTLGDLVGTVPYAGIEAPQLLSDGRGNIIMYTHAYAIGKTILTGLNQELPQVYGYIQLTYQNGFRTASGWRLNICKSDIVLRHLGVSYCGKKVYRLLKQIGIKPNPGYLSTNQIIGNGKNQVIVRRADNDYTGTYTLINYPQFIYRMSGGQNPNPTINVNNIFANEPLHMMFRNTKFTWGNGVITDTTNVFTNNPSAGGRHQWTADLYYQEDSGNTFAIVD